MSNTTNEQLQEVISKTLGMWLTKEADGTEWVEALEWHIGDGIDDCSGTDTEAQVKSYKEAREALLALIHRTQLESRIEELENFQWNDAHMYVRTRLNELQAALEKQA